MEVKGQIHALATLTPGKKTINHGQENGWAPQRVLNFQRRDISLVPEWHQLSCAGFSLIQRNSINAYLNKQKQCIFPTEIISLFCVFFGINNKIFHNDISLVVFLTEKTCVFCNIGFEC